MRNIATARLVLPRLATAPLSPATDRNVAFGDASAGSEEERSFVLTLAHRLHQCGTPAHRLEEALSSVCARMGIAAQIFTTPTSITVGFGPVHSQLTTILRIDSAEIHLGELARLDAIANSVANKSRTPEQGLAEILRERSQPTVARRLAHIGAYALTSASVAVFLAGGLVDVAVAAVIGIVVGVLSHAMAKDGDGVRIFELVGAFVATLGASAAGHFTGQVNTASITLAALIVLLPGLSLTTAMTELATRNLVSGSARLFAAVITLLELAIGVALGEKVADKLGWISTASSSHALPAWSVLIALAASITGLVAMTHAPRRDFVWIALAGTAGYFAARHGVTWLGPELGVGLGAFALGLFANAYARVLNRPAAIVIVPAITLLVPGSLGFRGFSSLVDKDTLGGIQMTMSMFIVAAALVAGLLIAQSVISPRRAL